MIRYISAAAMIAAAAFCLYAQDNAASTPAEPNATQPAGQAETQPAGNGGSPPAEGKVAYSQDFEKEIGGEWSSTTKSVTPKGENGFLGEFCNDKVTLSLDKLPKHKYIRLSLDLYVIRSWDGNFVKTAWGEMVGPNVVTIGVRGGAVLMNASFANISEYNQKQSYPDSYGFANYDPCTGVAAKNSLGFIFYKKFEMDAVYRLSFVLPHSEEAVKIDFSAASLQNADDESWGIDNVEVTLYEGPPSGSLDAEKLKALWGDLSGGDPARADKAIWTLVGAENSAGVTKLIADNLKLVRPSSEIPEDVAKLIELLDDSDWKVRENATEELKKMGEKVVPILRHVLEETKSAEVRTRIRQILRDAGVGEMNDSDLLVASRAVRVLQIIGNDETRQTIALLENQYPRIKTFTRTLGQDSEKK